MEGLWGAAELSVDQKGKIKQSIGNCIKALFYDERTKGMFKYNLMVDRVEIHGSWWNRSTESLSDNDINKIRLFLEQNYGLTHEKNIPRAIDIIAHQNVYHPIRDYLTGLEWDGVERIGNLFPKYLGAERCEYTTIATKVFMMGAIARVFKPGIKYDTMVCVVDDQQGGGKSTMARFMAIKDEWFTDDIKNLDDENIYRKLQGHWIIEFSEMLATSNTKTVEAIKAFLSKLKDTYKIPYERYAQDIPRQCVFLGTTNNLNFLPNDKTGNRRFIPILADRKQAEAHPLDNEQETREYVIKAWAEAMAIYKSGEYSLVFPKNMEKQLDELREDFTPEDPKVGIIQLWLDTCRYDSVCSILLYKEALGNENQEPKPWDLREINDIMNHNIVGWEKHPTKDQQVRFLKYGKQRAWDRSVHDKASPNGFMPVDSETEQMQLPFN